MAAWLGLGEADGGGQTELDSFFVPVLRPRGASGGLRHPTCGGWGRVRFRGMAACPAGGGARPLPVNGRFAGHRRRRPSRISVVDRSLTGEVQ
jgi:hypothetical protein